MGQKCIKDYTVVYSQTSIEALENLIDTFTGTFGLPITIQDLFYYGVFCKNVTYANHNWDEDEAKDDDLEIPHQLTSACSTPQSRLDYTNSIIKQIMMGEIEKPEWMIHIEMTEDANKYGLAPSTFLYIMAKEDKYDKLAQKLIEFLYSPNLLMTMIWSY